MQSGAIRADVAAEADVVALFSQAVERFGPLTGLVANAGIVDQAARLDTFTAERVARMMAVNVTGQIVCAREAVLRLSTRHGGSGGSIVFVSSAASRLGSPGTYVDYAASKGAVDTLTIGLAREVADEGVRVNAVRPGIIRTEIHADSGDVDRPAKAASLAPDGPPRRARRGRRGHRVAHVGRGRLHERRHPRRERRPLMPPAGRRRAGPRATTSVSWCGCAM